LKTLEPPVDILLALGHAGYQKDLQMAEEIEEIDIVVGGQIRVFQKMYTARI
jgi:2',3'-cyclic-nucleotide 2'-phosphodiesterase (5'-nucleotidase family)